MTYEKLKQEIEAASGVREWNPTPSDLGRIASALTALKSRKAIVTRSDVAMIVSRQFPGARFHVTAGVDTKDITSLLTIALKQTRN
ncbi:hypothetical protein EAH74_12030 [Pseudomonas mandelii]|jgi:hypothetical protein|uniref:Uncharacterized protein n=1 Tax=Pseudomonas mandelii TaxID=75612 RepID=A0A502IH38_9PSED|nr:hypothetical protein EAH74_12030 [Pseudomonas mandelii]